MKNKNELTIRFDSEINSIYEIGYLLVDIYQIIVFSEELENKNYNFLEKHFTEKKRKYVARNSSVLKKLRESAKIKTVKPGSVEIILAGVGIFATIIVPFIINQININRTKKNETITFEINSNDKYINNMIRMTQDGYFGEDGWKYLLERLSEKNYDISALSENTFRILDVSKAFCKRMVKVIPKQTKNKD